MAGVPSRWREVARLSGNPQRAALLSRFPPRALFQPYGHGADIPHEEQSATSSHAAPLRALSTATASRRKVPGRALSRLPRDRAEAQAQQGRLEGARERKGRRHRRARWADLPPSRPTSEAEARQALAAAQRSKPAVGSASPGGAPAWATNKRRSQMRPSVSPRGEAVGARELPTRW